MKQDDLTKKKKIYDKIEIFILALGIIVLPLFKGHFGISDNLMTVIVCGVTIVSILFVELINYKTDCLEAERKAKRINIWILLLLLCGVFLAGILNLFE